MIGNVEDFQRSVSNLKSQLFFQAIPSLPYYYIFLYNILIIN